MSVSDLAGSREFYEKFLGRARVASLRHVDRFERKGALR
jgi:hypothetical protein